MAPLDMTPGVLIGGEPDKAVFIPFGRVADGRYQGPPRTDHRDAKGRGVRR